MPPELDALATELHRAWLTANPIEPLSARYPSLTIDHAYGVQSRFVTLLAAGAAEPSGYKVGLTSAVMQRLLGVSEPDYASLLPALRVPSGGSIDRSSLIKPKAEAEIAIVLGRPLEGPGVSPSDVAAAAEGVAASIEIIDSRIVDWKISLIDTIADMASTARYVVSDHVIPVRGFEPRMIGVVAEHNGQLAATGAGAAALGDPFAAAAWTVNALSRHGVGIPAGSVILTGAVHAAFDVVSGDTVVARFDRLGTIEVTFT